MEKALNDILPVMGVEHDCILSKQGDITIVFEAALPEIFTLSDNEYEAFHQGRVKAVKALPVHTVFRKQAWFRVSRDTPELEPSASGSKYTGFLSRISERFFNELSFLEHSCYLLLTKKTAGRKPSSSLFSNLLRTSIVPEETLKETLLQDFLDSAGQFRRILEDSGFVQLNRLTANDLWSEQRKAGLIERYLTLTGQHDPLLKGDIVFDEGLQIGPSHCGLYTLGDAEDLWGVCGSRINYDKYSTDKAKFSIVFASTLGQLLPCNHIYNQYLFIEDSATIINKLESKWLRLQSLSAYSRENMIARDDTNAFLNEAISQGRLPLKAHFNVLVWTETPSELKELKNKVSSGLAQMDAVARQETTGAPQIFWAGIPGNEADFPMNDTFDT